MILSPPSPTVGDVLGRGASGTVFLQEQADCTKVAVKRAAWGTLRHERAILSRIHLPHPIPGIPRVYAGIDLDEERELVMEYIEGQVVEEAFQQADHPKTLLGSITEVFTIFACLHEKQIVHYDVHERNLLLSTTGHIYVIDFGCAFYQPDPCQYRREVVDLWILTRTWIELYLPAQSILGELYDGWYEQTLLDPQHIVFASDLLAAWHDILLRVPPSL